MSEENQKAEVPAKTQVPAKKAKKKSAKKGQTPARAPKQKNFKILTVIGGVRQTVDVSDVTEKKAREKFYELHPGCVISDCIQV